MRKIDGLATLATVDFAAISRNFPHFAWGIKPALDVAAAHLVLSVFLGASAHAQHPPLYFYASGKDGESFIATAGPVICAWIGLRRTRVIRISRHETQLAHCVAQNDQPARKIRAGSMRIARRAGLAHAITPTRERTSIEPE
jgi:hypothetical protein